MLLMIFWREKNSDGFCLVKKTKNLEITFILLENVEYFFFKTECLEFTFRRRMWYQTISRKKMLFTLNNSAVLP